MSNFAQALEVFIKQSGHSQKSLSSAIGISRAMLYSVLNNEKSLSEKLLHKLVNSVADTKEQKSMLRIAYYTDKYSAATLDKLCEIRDGLDSLGNECEEICTHEYNDAVIDSPEKLTDAVSYIVSEELKHQSPVIYTNYPFEMRHLDDAVYSLIKNSKEKISFNHFITFEHGNKTPHAITNIFSTVRYAKLGYSPLFRYSDNVEGSGVNSLYEYFFMTHDYILQLSVDGSSGIIVKSPKATEGAFTFIKEKLDRYTPLVTYSESLLGFKDNLVKNAGFSCKYALSSYMCIGGIDSPEILEAVARPDLPNREMLVNIAIHHYQNLAQHQLIKVMSVEGIREFVKTGIIHEFPQSWTVPLPPEKRRLIIEKFIDFVSAEKQTLYLYDKELYNTVGDTYFDLECYEDRICVYNCLADSEDTYTGQASINLSDSAVASDFCMFFEYIISNCMLYSKESSLYFLNELLIECDMQLKVQNN